MYNELFVVGYGYLNGKRVFKFRNSWGTNMGYNGYGYIHMNEYCNEITGFIHINGYRNKLSYLIAISIYMNISIAIITPVGTPRVSKFKNSFSIEISIANNK